MTADAAAGFRINAGLAGVIQLCFPFFLKDDS